jgi:excinuclease UvrABC nuclease subunit
MREVLTRRLGALVAERAGAALAPGAAADRRATSPGGTDAGESAPGGADAGESAPGGTDAGESAPGGADAGETVLGLGGADAGESARGATGVRAPRRRFAYSPQLLLLDGGKGQLSVGVQVLESLGLTGQIEIAALAKQFEEVYRPGNPDPVRIPRGSEALYLLQRVRDEAHRFAITFHRTRRGKRMTASVLDGVPGLGPARRARLIKEMGGMRALRQASEEDLRALPWLPDRVALAAYERLHALEPAAGASSVASGGAPMRENDRQ